MTFWMQKYAELRPTSTHRRTPNGFLADGSDFGCASSGGCPVPGLPLPRRVRLRRRLLHVVQRKRLRPTPGRPLARRYRVGTDGEQHLQTVPAFFDRLPQHREAPSGRQPPDRTGPDGVRRHAVLAPAVRVRQRRPRRDGRRGGAAAEPDRRLPGQQRHREAGARRVRARRPAPAGAGLDREPAGGGGGPARSQPPHAAAPRRERLPHPEPGTRLARRPAQSVGAVHEGLRPHPGDGRGVLGQPHRGAHPRRQPPGAVRPRRRQGRAGRQVPQHRRHSARVHVRVRASALVGAGHGRAVRQVRVEAPVCVLALCRRAERVNCSSLPMS